MISPREARRRLDDMIAAARQEEDGKLSKTFGGKRLMVLISPDDREPPAFLWGDNETLIGKHLAIRAIETYGS